MNVRECIAQAIYDWVRDNFGLCEADDPSWNIDSLADHIAKTLRRKLKNPPPKRVRLTKSLGNETRQFLNYLDFVLTQEAPMLEKALKNNGLAALQAKLEHLVEPGKKEET